MNTKNFVGTIASLIGSANDKHFTLDAVEVMEFVKQVISAITEEFRVLGKATIMSGEQALAKA